MDSTPVSLLKRLRQAPDAATWGKFINLYTPLFFEWASRLGLNEHDASDLVQETFTILVQHLPRFEYDPRQSFRGWLKTILLNCWRKHLSRHRSRSASPEELQALADSDPFVAMEEDEYHRFLVHRLMELVQVATPQSITLQEYMNDED